MVIQSEVLYEALFRTLRGKHCRQVIIRNNVSYQLEKHHILHDVHINNADMQMHNKP